MGEILLLFCLKNQLTLFPFGFIMQLIPNERRFVMKEYKIETVSGLSVEKKGTAVMNAYAEQGWVVFRTEVIGSYLVIIFERDK